MKTIKRALLSVSDKKNLVKIAQFLRQMQVEILSTGGTSEILSQHAIPHISVADYTGFPEILDGRVKTLHPKIHGAILARGEQDAKVLQQHAIDAIDLVIVNLYPFAKVTADPNCSLATAIENIDIGGPTLIRAAAKNYQHVAVVVDPNDYDLIINALKQALTLDEKLRFHLACKAFTHTAAYDAMIANYLQPSSESLPESLLQTWHNKIPLRYGENPHQQAAFYPFSHAINDWQSLQGKQLSYNNLTDATTALNCCLQFDEACCVIVKHMNPCGVAIAPNLPQAYQRAFACDVKSAFGGIIAFNQTVNEEAARTVINNQFVELIIAPEFTTAALEQLQAKPNVRVIAAQGQAYPLQFQALNHGVLVQQTDVTKENPDQFTCVTQQKPDTTTLKDLLFAWKVAKFVKSNAIVFVKDQATIGIGAGQMSRIDSNRIAKIKADEANLAVVGSVLASDAFFPYPDNVAFAKEIGIKAIIQPGGSKNDDAVVKAADESKISMLFTGIRHFRH